jgi:ABC-type phosphate transport system substrate-binding protein
MTELKGWRRAGRILALLGLVVAPGPVATASADGFRLIVNSSNSAHEIPRAEVAQCFLGGPRRWANGQVLVPIDQSTKSEVRRAFSQQVLLLDVEAVQVQWIRAITQGKGRPPLSASEADVIETVGKDPRMIGYVSADSELPPSVKVITVRD